MNDTGTTTGTLARAAAGAQAARGGGPNTAAGKAVSRCNATRHGLAAGALTLLPDESAEAFEAFRDELLAELAPGTALEAALAEDALALMWRLRRAHRLEAQLLAARAAQWRVRHAERAAVLEERDRQGVLSIEESALTRPEACAARAEAGRAELGLGQALAEDAGQGDGLGKLARYESALRRNLERTLAALARAQRLRALARGYDDEDDPTFAKATVDRAAV